MVAWCKMKPFSVVITVPLPIHYKPENLVSFYAKDLYLYPISCAHGQRQPTEGERCVRRFWEILFGQWFMVIRWMLEGQVQCFSYLILRCCINCILTSVTIILAHLGILWTDGKIRWWESTHNGSEWGFSLSRKMLQCDILKANPAEYMWQRSYNVHLHYSVSFYTPKNLGPVITLQNTLHNQ